MEVRFDSVSKRFGDFVVLDQLNFTLNKGECLTILGKSGTGKSVLLKHIVGLLKPDEGRVYFQDICVSQATLTQVQEVRKKCGLVFQLPALIDSLSIEQNLMLPFEIQKTSLSLKQKKKKIVGLSEKLKLDRSVFPAYPKDVSYGLQKKISLIRTLLMEPECILFDEPTTGQDPKNTKNINFLMRQLHQEMKITTLIVSHDIKSSLEISDRLIVMDQGKQIFSGKPSEIHESSHPIVKGFLDVS